MSQNHPHDARLAIARLTAEGKELVSDAAGVVRDAMAQIVKRTVLIDDHRTEILAMLHELAKL